MRTVQPLVGKWLRLPRSFWGAECASDFDDAADGKGAAGYDLVRITGHKPAKEGYYESLEFQWPGEDKYEMRAAEARVFHKKGLFQGKAHTLSSLL